MVKEWMEIKITETVQGEWWSASNAMNERLEVGSWCTSEKYINELKNVKVSKMKYADTSQLSWLKKSDFRYAVSCGNTQMIITWMEKKWNITFFPF